MTICIVIPAYNEERHIRACLDAIATQTRLPDEVIVVDNNSIDRTAAYAAEYPFVKVITESRQGRGYARSAGFDAATSDIIGRIDADSKLTPNWVERVLAHFERHNIDGLTGLGLTAFIPYVNWPKSTIYSRSYYWFVHSRFRTVTMWGATMAITADAWYKVKESVVKDDALVHEDQDISLRMAAKGLRIIQANDVRIMTNGQEYRYLPKLRHYYKLFKSTKKLHTDNGNLAHISPKLSSGALLPGYIAAMIIGTWHVFTSIVLFPIDYILMKSKSINSRFESN